MRGRETGDEVNRKLLEGAGTGVTFGPGRDERRLKSQSVEDEVVSEESDTKGRAA